MTSVIEDQRVDGALDRMRGERDEAQAAARRLAEAREADAREGLRHLRNLLSVVRVLAQRTADDVATVEEFRAVFDGRLTALSRAQSMPGDPRSGRDLGAIFGDELLGFGMGVGAEVELAGPLVRVPPRAAGLLALAAHELASGLAGDGARGPVRVEWTVGEALEIDWIEPAGAQDAAPLPHWVERAIAYELKGCVSEERGRDALRRRISLPATGLRVE